MCRNKILKGRDKMDVRACNDELIGIKLKTIPLISMQLGHRKVGETIEYDVVAGKDINTMFLSDLFNLTTDEIIEKWYGGEDNARNLLSQLDGIWKDK